ncbi:hypothetical protein LSAT2_007212 [Lamellibrachia satsuma]|nr:hypothetical protein LSAT2_007212 [Lamellibrachia satsuma]
MHATETSKTTLDHKLWSIPEQHWTVINTFFRPPFPQQLNCKQAIAYIDDNSECTSDRQHITRHVNIRKSTCTQQRAQCMPSTQIGDWFSADKRIETWKQSSVSAHEAIYTAAVAIIAALSSHSLVLLPGSYCTLYCA